MPNSFRTARGRAQFEGDRLRFVDGDGIGTLAAALTADSIPARRRRLIAGGVVAGLALTVAVAVAATGPWRWLLLGAAAAVAAVAAIRRRQVPAGDATIPIDAVESVSIRRRFRGLSRPLVVIRYRDEGGTKHCHVRLPRGLYGFDAAGRAREAFVHREVRVEGPN